jgi:hypothetical protein
MRSRAELRVPVRLPTEAARIAGDTGGGLRRYHDAPRALSATAGELLSGKYVKGLEPDGQGFKKLGSRHKGA